jgi:hypothetical protein
MDKICIVVQPGEHDKPSENLVKAITELGMPCIASEKASAACFCVGWGRAVVPPGLNRVQPRDKLSELKMLARAGVATIPFDETYEAAVRRAFRARCKEPKLLGRLKYHTGGKDIYEFPLTKATLRDQLLIGCPAKRDFWTRVVPKENEYRVHVFCGQAEWAATKIPKDEAARRSLIWNSANCDFDYDAQKIPDRAKEAAIRAVASYGADFGAVDILQAPLGRCYVLEVNLRPGLGKESLQYYARKFVAAARAIVVP